MGLWPTWNRYNAAASGNGRIHEKIDKSHRNADVYADIAKAVKKQGLSWTWLEAVLKKVCETSKSCNYQTGEEIGIIGLNLAYTHGQMVDGSLTNQSVRFIFVIFIK